MASLLEEDPCLGERGRRLPAWCRDKSTTCAVCCQSAQGLKEKGQYRCEAAPQMVAYRIDYRGRAAEAELNSITTGMQSHNACVCGCRHNLLYERNWVLH